MNRASCLTRAIAVVLAVAGLTACATQPALPKNERSPADPWEPLNRQIHGFNTTFDKYTLKPIAKVYGAVVPQIIRTGVGNVSQNLRSPLHAISGFLQGNVKTGLKQTGRFVANSTFGLLGMLDVATSMGLERQREDFGQVFAKWGLSAGPYVVIPVLGPSTVRDGIGIPFNFLADPLTWYDNSSVRDKAYFIRLVDVRERLFDAESLLDGSTDRYIAIREAYLQNREYLLYDGDPPVDDDFYDDFDDDFDEDFDDAGVDTPTDD